MIFIVVFKYAAHKNCCLQATNIIILAMFYIITSVCVYAMSSINTGEFIMGEMATIISFHRPIGTLEVRNVKMTVSYIIPLVNVYEALKAFCINLSMSLGSSFMPWPSRDTVTLSFLSFSGFQ